MKETRRHGVVLRAARSGWQVGDLAYRMRDGRRVEHLVRIQYFPHIEMEKAKQAFKSRVAARAPHRKRRPSDALPRIYVRVSLDDRAVIEKAAGLYGQQAATYVRDVALEHARSTLKCAARGMQLVAAI